mmetsp:Transcript_37943/g.88098  ORF Transcript_37943/g.88098 Transcript_37943/m.88098 type:complete len:169 (+) Transcript_37943:71-577(+)
MVVERSFPKKLDEHALPPSLQGLGVAKAGTGDIAAEQAIRTKVATQRVVALDDAVSQHIARALAELEEAVTCLRQRGLAADALFTGNMREVNTRIKAYEARARTYRQLLRELSQLPAPLAMSASEQDVASILQVRGDCQVDVWNATESCRALEQEAWQSNRAKRLLCL